MPFSIGFILLTLLVFFAWWCVKPRRRDSLMQQSTRRLADYRDRGRR